jgi:hypothetical protein
MSATDHTGEMCLCHTAKECKAVHLKASGTLANNLCPDCRDKQMGQPCLGCTIQRLRGLLNEAQAHIEGRPMSQRTYTPKRLSEKIEEALRATL